MSRGPPVTSLIGSIWSHPANRGARFRALARALAWQCRKRLTGRALDIDFHGFRLRCHPDSHGASRAIYFREYPDYAEMCFMRDYLRPGDVFVDVGANVGLYALLAASLVAPHGQVHALEPAAATHARLAETVALNPSAPIRLHRVGAGERSSTVAFEPSADDCTSHVATHTDTVSDARIEIVRLDEYLPRTRYAMLKMDIEGYEPFALEGASRLLEEGNPPVMQLELAGHARRYGVSTPEIVSRLEHQGYATAVYRPRTRAIEWTAEPWQLAVDNVLAICTRHERFVRERLDARAGHPDPDS